MFFKGKQINENLDRKLLLSIDNFVRLISIIKSIIAVLFLAFFYIFFYAGH